MAKRVLGDEARGQDDDEGNAGLRTEKVQIENSYFEKLKTRLRNGGVTVWDLTALEPTTAEPEGTPAGLSSSAVIYNDDGSIYKKP